MFPFKLLCRRSVLSAIQSLVELRWSAARSTIAVLGPPCVPLKSTKFQFDKTQLDPSLLEQQGTTTHRTFPPNNPKLKDAIAFNLSTELSSKTRQIDAAKQIEDAKRNSKTRSAQLASKRVSLIAREQKHEAAIRERVRDSLQ